MVLETIEGFSFEAKLKSDAQNPKVCEWETLMAKFQQPLPDSKPGEKWRATEIVFKLSDAD
jgi:L-rhamnose mutarotase